MIYYNISDNDNNNNSNKKISSLIKSWINNPHYQLLPNELNYNFNTFSAFLSFE